MKVTLSQDELAEAVNHYLWRQPLTKQRGIKRIQFTYDGSTNQIGADIELIEPAKKAKK